MDPQVDAVPAPVSATARPAPGQPTADAPPSENGAAANGNGSGNGALTVEQLREAAARRLAVPAGVPTIADIADGAEPAQGQPEIPEAQVPVDEEPPDLLEAAELLRHEVASLQLPLEVEGAAAAREEREALLGQLDDYLLPRLRRLDAPLLAVVGGSTGAGKSTLVNSIARREVTRSGVLRPTTRSPVLVHHPYDSGAFLSQRVLPGLARVTSEAPSRPSPSTSTRRASPLCGWCRTKASRPAWRSSTLPTSTPSSRPTATSPSSSSRPRTCGSSSRRRPATATPSRGRCSSRPSTAA